MEPIALVAELIRERNLIDGKIAQIIGRPPVSGHLGEWLASQIFDIELERSASAAGIDGHFRSGALEGRTVNIKWYLKQEGLLDLNESLAPDFYLVLTGPRSSAMSSRGGLRPWCIQSVYLFNAEQLHAEQMARGVKGGIASSVRAHQWTAAQIYPAVASSQVMPLTERQRGLLALFDLTVTSSEA